MRHTTFYAYMKCPFCAQTQDRVLDTRIQKEGSIRRRRECLSCRGRYSTIETVVLDYPFVIKKDGRREAFQKEKILTGIQKACQKRPVSQAQINASVEKVSAWVINRGEPEISSDLVGKKLMAELKELDNVAYIRFASVYRTFKDVKEFVHSLEDEEFVEGAPENPKDSQLRLKPLES